MTHHNGGQGERTDSNGEGRVLVVRNWHIIFLLAVQLLALATAYGRISERLDQTVKQLERIDGRPVVSQSEFDSWRAEIFERINQIENSVERLRLGQVK